MPIYATIIGGAVLSGALWLQTELKHAANERLDAAMAMNATLEQSIEQADAQIAAYRLTNAANTAQRIAAEEAAERAKENLIKLDEITTRHISTINTELEAMRNESDDTCRTLVDPLPDDFIEWVFNP